MVQRLSSEHEVDWLDAAGIAMEIEIGIEVSWVATLGLEANISDLIFVDMKLIILREFLHPNKINADFSP